MLTYDLKFNDEQVQQAEKALAGIPHGAGKALSRAINRAMEKARTETVRAVCDKYSIKPSRVRKTIKLFRARANNPTGTLMVTGAPIELVQFLVKPKKPPRQAGVQVARRPATIVGVKFGRRKTLPHAFVARMENGHIGVFSRKYTSSKPIEQRYTLAVPQMVGSHEVMAHLTTEAQQVLNTELDRQIDLLFRGDAR